MLPFSWPGPAFNNNSHSSLICDYFQFLLTIHLCLSSLHAFHSIPPCPSCSLNYLCCAIHPCHFTLSALDPVCCCILTASLFSPCTLITAWTHFPSLMLPHAPGRKAGTLFTLYHVDACLLLLFSCLLFNSHMPIAQFMPLTLLISVIPPILFTCFMLLTHFSIIFLIFLCLSLHTS